MNLLTKFDSSRAWKSMRSIGNTRKGTCNLLGKFIGIQKKTIKKLNSVFFCFQDIPSLSFFIEYASFVVVKWRNIVKFFLHFLLKLRRGCIAGGRLCVYVCTLPTIEAIYMRCTGNRAPPAPARAPLARLTLPALLHYTPFPISLSPPPVPLPGCGPLASEMGNQMAKIVASEMWKQCAVCSLDRPVQWVGVCASREVGVGVQG